jgi:Gti1/Pac2 family
VGYVNSTADAAYLVSAASRGMIPRITRRLFSDERLALVKSGSVFVFSVNESCINRWTDGKSWSPTRIKENFLVSNYHAVTNFGILSSDYQVSREVGHLGTVRVNILFKKVGPVACLSHTRTSPVLNRLSPYGWKCKNIELCPTSQTKIWIMASCPVYRLAGQISHPYLSLALFFAIRNFVTGHGYGCTMREIVDSCERHSLKISTG